MEKKQILQQYFGHTAFREGQEQVIDAILQGRDVLGIMPTGAGKSVCYQLSAMLLHGVTFVISPLISLMKDQVDSLRQIGIPAAYINSSLSFEEMQDTLYQTKLGQYRILYIAPERLQSERFFQLAVQIPIAMVTVDEAHCVSQWGQDFRQSYLEIAKFIEKLPQRPIVSAFTATATEQVSQDICRLLELKTPYQITTGFDRKNLYFSVQRPKDKDVALLAFLKRNANKSGIVYCLARKTVEELCDMLCDKGYAATRYHAGLSQAERMRNQEEFLYDRKTVMVATNAFGMGIDKSNVAFVVHYNMPKDLESYYQEAGRAGRDGEPAECVLFYHTRDNRTNLFLIHQSNDSESISDPVLQKRWIEQSEQRLQKMTSYALTTDCLRYRMLRYFGEHTSRCCGNCSNCKGNFVEKDITLETQKIISCVYRGLQKRYHLSRTMTANVLTGSKAKNVLEMHLDKLSTYGIIQNYSQFQVVQMIDHLLNMGILTLQPYHDFQFLQLTGEAALVLRGEKAITWRQRTDEPEVFGALEAGTGGTVESDLFEKLRKLTLKIATAEKVPPYVVFSTASLRDMCRKQPKTMEEFRTISGVGMIKLKKYGEIFLKEIRTYQEEHPQ